MKYKFRENFKFSPNGNKMIEYQKDQILEDPPERLLKICTVDIQPPVLVPVGKELNDFNLPEILHHIETIEDVKEKIAYLESVRNDYCRWHPRKEGNKQSPFEENINALIQGLITNSIAKPNKKREKRVKLEKMRWLGSNTQLAYLIKWLADGCAKNKNEAKDNLIQKDSDYWEWAQSCFLDKNGDEFKPNALAQALSNYEQRYSSEPSKGVKKLLSITKKLPEIKE